jgi:hypothetical protein
MDTRIPYHPRPLTANEAALNAGMTHIATITAQELTETTVNTAQTFTLCALKAGDILMKVAWRIKTFFKDASDTAFNTTTLSVGNTATGVAAHVAAIETNVNGTEVRQGFSNTAVHYAAADSLTVTLNAMAAKALSNIDAGEIEILFQILRPATLEEAAGASLITK